jgi:hypothetical protein
MVPGPSRTSANEHQRTALTCNTSNNRRSEHDRYDLDTVEVTGSIPVSPTTQKRRSEALSFLRGGGASGVFGRQMGVDLRTMVGRRLLDRLELVDRLRHLRQQRDQPLLWGSKTRFGL